MNVRQILPKRREISANEVLRCVQAVRSGSLPAGSGEAKNFCTELSSRLLRDRRAQAFPELQALGFWLRPAHLESMLQKYLNRNRRSSGLVFQIPPGNVDALFGYTLAISLLCGNATIIRLSSAERPAQVLLVQILEEALERASPDLREHVILLRYTYDDYITAQFSSACNLRLIWGSDETIQHISRLPLPSSSRAIDFGDRFSASALKTDRYLSSDPSERDELIRKFFNDMYWYDQLACSSPRLLLWIGDVDEAKSAAEDFYPRLAAYAAQCGYSPSPAGSMAKFNASILALYDLAPKDYKVYAPQLSVVTLGDLSRLSAFKPLGFGYGLLLAVRLDRLETLADFAERRDQTLALWGLDEAEVKSFAKKCEGRGFSRIVPVGQALSFDAEWEGINLFEAMTCSAS